ACEEASFRYYGLSDDQKGQLQEWAIQKQKIETAKSPTQNKLTSEPYQIETVQKVGGAMGPPGL
ncbi:MAG: hypothetical protein WCB92_00980, partial [Mycobacterium sp.]